MRDFSAVELGASLYVPATHKDILAIANGEKFPHLKSVIFCLEDAINCDDLEVSMKNITNMLNNFEQNELKLFIRPRDIENLTQLLKAPNIKKIDGFALAKFSTCNMHEYLSVLETTCSAFHLMPVLESLDMFDINALKNIREFLLKKRIHNILTIRVGAEDMFKMIGIKKDCNTSIHDLHVSSRVLADILATFKPYGFNVSSTVYNCLKNLEFFTQEVRRDVKEGLFGKTLIHPSQIDITNEVYRVSKDELEEAEIILKKDEAIYRHNDKMIESSVHKSWASTILKRFEVYGVTN